MEAISATLWYTITSIVLFKAWAVAQHVFPADRTSQRVIHAVVLVWTWIALCCTVLGALGQLDAGSLGASVLLVSAGVEWYSRRFNDHRPDARLVPGTHSGSDIASELRSSSAPGHATSLIPLNFWPYRVLWNFVIAFGLVLVITRAVLRYPMDWDTLMYHRPLIDLWLQHGTLHTPQSAVWYNPGANELIGLWFAAPFSGDFWVGLMGIPSMLLLVMATYECGVLFKLPSPVVHAVAIASISTPVALYQLPTAKNDIAVCALFLTGVAYGIRAIVEHNQRALAFSGLALGLLAGVKYYALGYAVVGCCALMLLMWFCRGGRHGLRCMCLLGTLIALNGGYWYGRNYAATGSPIYPALMSQTPELEQLSSRNRWRSSILGNGRLDTWPQYLSATWSRGSMLHSLSVLMLPLSVLWLLGRAIRASLLRENAEGFVTQGYFFALLIVMAWLIFGVTPFTVSASSDRMLSHPHLLVRFSLVPLTLSVLLLAVFVSDVATWLERVDMRARFGRFASGALVYGFAALPVCTLSEQVCEVALKEGAYFLIVVFDVAVLLLLCGKAFGAMRPLGRKWDVLVLPALLCAGMCAFVPSTLWLSKSWHSGFAAHYDRQYDTEIFSTLAALDDHSPAIVALCYRYYPFFGSRRQFFASRPRRIESERKLYEYVARYGARFVAGSHRYTQRFAQYEMATEWATANAGVFFPIHDDRRFILFSVDQSELCQFMRAGVEERNEP